MMEEIESLALHEGAAEPDVHALASRLRPILLRLNRCLRSEVNDLGVTTIQASLLSALQRMPDIGLKELAEREHISSPTLVAHIDRLEAAGLVERMRNHSQDRRRVGLTVTPKGLNVLQALRERRTTWLALRLDKLSPQDLAALEAAIEPLQQLARSDA